MDSSFDALTVCGIIWDFLLLVVLPSMHHLCSEGYLKSFGLLRTGAFGVFCFLLFFFLSN